MLFGIISELISRITRSVSLFHSTYLWKFTAKFILDFRKETRSLEAIQEFGVQFALFSKVLNDVRAFLWYISLTLYEKSTNGMLLILLWINSSNKLNLLHVEVYQNEISQGLPTVLFSVICCQSRVYHD